MIEWPRKHPILSTSIGPRSFEYLINYKCCPRTPSSTKLQPLVGVGPIPLVHWVARQLSHLGQRPEAVLLSSASGAGQDYPYRHSRASGWSFKLLCFIQFYWCLKIICYKDISTHFTVEGDNALVNTLSFLIWTHIYTWWESNLICLTWSLSFTTGKSGECICLKFIACF